MVSGEFFFQWEDEGEPPPPPPDSLTVGVGAVINPRYKPSVSATIKSPLPTPCL